MKALWMIRATMGGGAAFLLAGVLAAAAPAAQAGTGRTVPCDAQALITAINAANSGGGATINLARRCTYRLTTASSRNPQLGDTGLPVITSRITLNGFRTTIAGNDSSFRILMVTKPGNLTLRGLTITGGKTPGPGGGIFNLEGTLLLSNTRVTGNTSAGGMMSAGGGIASGTLGTGPLGTTVLNFSRVDDNTSSASAGGILNHGGTLILNASQVDDNTAGQGGGGIASGTGGMGGPGSSILVLNASQVEGNTANGGPMAGAGGIANGGTATISSTEVEGNTAPGSAGGGILNHGVMTISQSRVTGNTTPADSAGDQGIGGGIANINLGQVAPGAVNAGILTITFSQISRNTASGQGGGIFEATITPTGTSAGGALTLAFSKVTGNQAAQGGGIFAVPGSPVTLVLTAVTRNKPDNCAPPGSVPGCTNKW
jgi:hypothetical protein